MNNICLVKKIGLKLLWPIFLTKFIFTIYYITNSLRPIFFRYFLKAFIIKIFFVPKSFRQNGTKPVKAKKYKTKNIPTELCIPMNIYQSKQTKSNIKKTSPPM